jgi:hypothetical protein
MRRGRQVVLNVAIYGAFLLIVAILGVFLWQASFGSNQHGQSGEKAEISHGEQKAGEKDSLGGGSAKHADNPTEEAIAYYTKWLAFFTFCLVLATVGLFVSGERNVEVASKSALAAQTSADATRDAVKLSEKTAEYQLRAYVVFDDVKIIKDPAAPTMFFADAAFKNVGQSPAYEFSALWGITIAPYPITGIPWSPKIVGPGYKAILGPSIRGSSRLMLNDPISPENLAAINAGTSAVLIWGEIRYKDIFGQDRWTKIVVASQGAAFRMGRFHEAGDETAN